MLLTHRASRSAHLPLDLLACLCLCAALLGVPSTPGAVASPCATAWSAAGPWATPDSEGMGIGSINSVAWGADSSTLFVGASNGGVWKTEALNGDNTSWQPLSDANQCNSVASVAVSPDDSAFIAYACGNVSSYILAAGPLYGIYISVDEGNSWSLAPLDYGFNFAKILVSGKGSAGSGRIIAAAKGSLQQQGAGSFIWTVNVTAGGIMYSADSGASFTVSSDPLVQNQPIRDLTWDPANPDTVFAIRTDGAVLLSMDFGQTWKDIGSGIDYSSLQGPVINARIAYAHSNLYIAAIDGEAGDSPDGRTHGVAAWNHDVLSGGSWSQAPLTPDVSIYSGQFFLALAVDPVQANLIYVAGPVQALYVGDTTQPGPAMWTAIESANPPHDDLRSLTFQPGSNQLALTCDGGIWTALNPATASVNWTRHNGDLQITEFNTVGYDPATQTFAGAAQDNGVWISNATDIKGGFGPNNFLCCSWALYTSIFGGDGEGVTFDLAPSIGGPAIMYGTYQDLGGWFAYQLLQPQTSLTAINASIPDGIFTQSLVINPINTSQIMTCGSRSCYVFEWPPSAPLDPNPAMVTVSSVPFSDFFIGGMRNGEAHPEVLFGIQTNLYIVATDSAGTNHYTSNSGWYNGNQPWFDGQTLHTDLSVDPTDYFNILTVTSESRVHYSTDFGATWTDVSGNLNSVSNSVESPRAWANVIIPLPNQSSPINASSPVNALLVGTAVGVFASFSDAVGEWHAVGTALPSVLIGDMNYNAAADLLVLGTLGRGWWSLSGAMSTLVEIHQGTCAKANMVREDARDPRVAQE